MPQHGLAIMKGSCRTLACMALFLVVAIGLAPAARAAAGVSCGNFNYQEDAQAFFVSQGGRAGAAGDPHGLDDDHDGIACEGLPHRPDTATRTDGRASSVSTVAGARVAHTCRDFSSQATAQAYFDSLGGSRQNNVDGLDSDRDGLACEGGVRAAARSTRRVSSDELPVNGMAIGHVALTGATLVHAGVGLCVVAESRLRRRRRLTAKPTAGRPRLERRDRVQRPPARPRVDAADSARRAREQRRAVVFWPEA